MRAIRVSAYGGPEVLKLEEIPAPQPGAGQVVVRNHEGAGLSRGGRGGGAVASAPPAHPVDVHPTR